MNLLLVLVDLSLCHVVAVSMYQNARSPVLPAWTILGTYGNRLLSDRKWHKTDVPDASRLAPKISARTILELFQPEVQRLPNPAIARTPGNARRSLHLRRVGQVVFSDTRTCWRKVAAPFQAGAQGIVPSIEAPMRRRMLPASPAEPRNTAMPARPAPSHCPAGAQR